ncbi:unnamed protein product [Candida verbasci]|uniref:SUR7 family protein FMP45 n=1 Tax=Candida verbasci TaxID=1227364 RepID=A0A9W4U280_9ASCO|nr:unnamed protein product [Candida verbasci]
MKFYNTFINLFFLAGTILLLIFTVLSGSSNHFPLNRFYWLEADTSDIPNAPADRSAWTFWGVCDKDDYSNCLTGPAYPISPEDNFNATSNVPLKFLNQQNTFYYLSRFSFAFCLIALAFTGISFIIGILSFCFLVIDKIVIFLISIGLLFLTAFCSCQTAVIVLAKQAFNDADRYAHVGAKSMGIMWASFVCLVICWLLVFSSNIAQSYRKHMNRVNQEKGYNQQQQGYPENDQSSFTRSQPVVKDETPANNNTGGIRFFKIKRNQKVSDEESE